MPASRKLLIDTDTASDDAVALLMALGHAEVEVVAVTVVAGNVPLEQAVQNALYTLELAGSAVPVHAGAAAPLAQALETGHGYHGQDGMGDVGLPLHGRRPADGHGVDVLIQAVLAHEPGELTLVALGPLTNVALALARAPELATRLAEIVVMGGAADAVGNMSAVAEYNVFVDPEAAAIVFASGARLTMVGWDVARLWAEVTRDELDALRELGPLGAFAADVQPGAAERRPIPWADPIAMAVALHPAVAVRTEHLNVVIELRGEHTRGQTVVDHAGVTGRSPNVDVVLETSREVFLELLRTTLAT